MGGQVKGAAEHLAALPTLVVDGVRAENAGSCCARSRSAARAGRGDRRDALRRAREAKGSRRCHDRG
jgi:hypothetical protein